MESEHFNIVVCGPPDSGKSCLISRLVYGFFALTESNNIVSFHQLNIEGQKPALVTFWDISQPSLHMEPLPMYYRNADAIIFCWPADRSFNSLLLTKFITHINTFISNIPIYLCITKSDLCDYEPHIHLAHMFVKNNNSIKAIYYTSSLQSTGITEMFIKIINNLSMGTFKLPQQSKNRLCCCNII